MLICSIFCFVFVTHSLSEDFDSSFKKVTGPIKFLDNIISRPLSSVKQCHHKENGKCVFDFGATILPAQGEVLKSPYEGDSDERDSDEDDSDEDFSELDPDASAEDLTRNNNKITNNYLDISRNEERKQRSIGRTFVLNIGRKPSRRKTKVIKKKSYGREKKKPRAQSESSSDEEPQQEVEKSEEEEEEEEEEVTEKVIKSIGRKKKKVYVIESGSESESSEEVAPPVEKKKKKRNRFAVIGAAKKSAKAKKIIKGNERQSKYQSGQSNSHKEAAKEDSESEETTPEVITVKSEEIFGPKSSETHEQSEEFIFTTTPRAKPKKKKKKGTRSYMIMQGPQRLYKDSDEESRRLVLRSKKDSKRHTTFRSAPVHKQRVSDDYIDYSFDRRALPHFMPKRYFWKQDEYLDLGQFWYDGPQGSNPGPYKINY